MAFDPDAYLKETPKSGGFDPDSYLKQDNASKIPTGGEKTVPLKGELAGEPKFLEKAAMTASAVPAFGLAAGGLKAASAGTRFAPYAAQLAETFVPKTLGSLAKATGAAGAVGAGAEGARSIAEKRGASPATQELVEMGAGLGLGGLTALPSLAKSGARALLGVPSKTGEAIAKEAEKLGFKLSPAQVRAQEPIGAKGATFTSEKNQSLANKLASRNTGVEVSEIDSKFIGDRLKDLGGEYDKIYKGKTFNIDKSAVDAINQISAMEAQLPSVAGVSPVKQVADEIVSNFQSLTNRKGAMPDTFGIEGEALQRMRNALTQRARGTSAGNAREIYNLVDQIDASVARNHPDIAAKLDVIRPQYRNTIILEDLYKQGGIHQGNISLDKLGNMLRTDRSVVRRGEADIDKLGEIGREMQLKALWETTGAKGTPGSDVLKSALGTTLGMGATGLGLRSAPARTLQRKLTAPSQPRIPISVPAVVSPISSSLQEDKK
jgi:hypothetical protein